MQKLSLILCLFVVLSFFSSCNKDDTGKTSTSDIDSESQTEDSNEIKEEDKIHHHYVASDGGDVFIPSLWLHYEGKKTNALLNKVNWKADKNAEEFNISGREALFYASEIDEIEISKETVEVELEFTKDVKNIVIHKWIDEYIGNGDKIEDFEEVEVSDNKISLSKNNVYEIFAGFSQGSVSYLVYVK